ncbi:MYOC [Bugula neritina]|uniref:MYOC n=1 Tax=Bugula neritina TaxID=10212 RepID=A0A7J7J7Z5_BUGNE|nr:MYOC [Bugula neritina]
MLSLKILVTLFSLLLTFSLAAAQTTAAVDEDAGTISVSTSPCDDGVCQCTVETPPRYSYDAEYAKLVSISSRLDSMYAQVSGAYMELLMSNITVLVSRVTKIFVLVLYLFCSQSITVSMKELASLQDQSNNLFLLITQLAETNNATITRQLVAEISTIRDTLLVLNSKNPVAQNAELNSEISKLRSRLAACTTVANKHVEEGLDFIGDGLSASHAINTDHCPTNLNISVGSPITYKYEYQVSGMWFKDPIPIAEHEKTRIFEVRNGPQTGYTNQYLYYWDDLDEFESTNYLTRAEKSLRCRFHVHGQKGIYLGGEWFWFDQYSSSRHIKKFSSPWNTTCGLVTSPKSYTYVGFNYVGHSYNDVDLNFDETGELYAIYADINGDLNIMSISRSTLAMKRNWNTGKKKASLANVFMVCGRLYTIDDFGSTRHLSGLQWGFDTVTGTEFFYPLNVESAYGDIQALSYNPREKGLFGWDNYHAVFYPVYF